MSVCVFAVCTLADRACVHSNVFRLNSHSCTCWMRAALHVPIRSATMPADTSEIHTTLDWQLRVCVCLRVCACVYVHACTRVLYFLMHFSLFVRLYVWVREFVPVFICVRAWVHNMHLRMCVCVCANCVHLCTIMHVHVHVHVRVCVCVCTRVRVLILVDAMCVRMYASKYVCKCVCVWILLHTL